MGLVLSDDGWRIPDEVWAQMQPLLPERSALGSGLRRASSSSSGGVACSPTTLRQGSNGSGWRSAVRSGRRRSAAS